MALLDETDWRLLAELQADGRVSHRELARRVHLSPPAVADRVRRLEETGVITGYRAQVDAARTGSPLTAFVHLHCSLGRCLLKTTDAADHPEIVEIHKLGGNFCSLLKVRTASLQHFESLIERLGEHGELQSEIALSTQYDGRPVEPPPADEPAVTQSAGWRRR